MDKPNVALRVRAGLPFQEGGESKLGRAQEIMLQLPRNLDALKLCRELHTYELFELDQQTWMLAYGESIRIGDTAAIERLQRIPRLVGSDRKAFVRYVKGEPVELGLGVDSLALRAAAELVRSRNPQLPAEERAKLLAAAEKDDYLKTAVSKARVNWAHYDQARSASEAP
jgi:hypothetical protein